MFCDAASFYWYIVEGQIVGLVEESEAVSISYNIVPGADSEKNAGDQLLSCCHHTHTPTLCCHANMSHRCADDQNKRMIMPCCSDLPTHTPCDHFWSSHLTIYIC